METHKITSVVVVDDSASRRGRRAPARPVAHADDLTDDVVQTKAASHPAAAVRRRRRADRRRDHHARGRHRVQGVPHPRRRGDRLGAARRADGRPAVGARRPGATAQRAAQLGIRIVVQGVANKLGGVRADPARRRRSTTTQVAYMGDDLLDLPVLRARRASRRRRPTRRRRSAAACTGSARAAAAAARCASCIELVLRAQGTLGRRLVAAITCRA